MENIGTPLSFIHTMISLGNLSPPLCSCCRSVVFFGPLLLDLVALFVELDRPATGAVVAAGEGSPMGQTCQVELVRLVLSTWH